MPKNIRFNLKNRPSLEYLREIAHLRFRTNTFGSVFRVRHALAFAIINSSMKKDLCTCIRRSSLQVMQKVPVKCLVTTLPFDNTPRNEDGTVNFKEDFFGRATNLTVSGQLEGELGATAFGDIYTFGPTFRAENSNTARHLAEFWMIEPEMAFYDLEDNMNLAEELSNTLFNMRWRITARILNFLRSDWQKKKNNYRRISAVKWD